MHGIRHSWIASFLPTGLHNQSTSLDDCVKQFRRGIPWVKKGTHEWYPQLAVVRVPEDRQASRPPADDRRRGLLNK